jgi:4'-phosphopantetheinyl transferase
VVLQSVDGGTRPLDDDEVRVFLADPAAISSRPDAERVLSTDDRAHITRFRFERDRTLALASRALQRHALSACAAVDASAWQFEVNEYGKPAIVAPTLAPTLSFSVANTHGLVACSVTRARPVGVDVEGVRADVPLGVVQRCWSLEERAAFDALSPADQQRRFVETWTAKEAYAKARGLGLSIDLRLVEVAVRDDGPQLILDPALEDNGAAWQLVVWAPTGSHVAAVCARIEAGPARFTSVWVADAEPHVDHKT